MTGEEPNRSAYRTDSRTETAAPREAVATLRRFSDDLPSGRALDVATGCGRNAIYLADRGWTVDAIDISRTKLSRARDRAGSRAAAIGWILGDVDRYSFPKSVYDVVTISYFDARDRLPAIIAALAPGGFLVCEHYLESPNGESRPSDRYRFESNELLSLCADLDVRWYVEGQVRGEPRVALVAQKPSATRRLPDVAFLEDPDGSLNVTHR